MFQSLFFFFKSDYEVGRAEGKLSCGWYFAMLQCFKDGRGQNSFPGEDALSTWVSGGWVKPQDAALLEIKGLEEVGGPGW